MKLYLSYFHVDPECNFHVSFIKLKFLTDLLNQYIIENSTLNSIEPDWIYSFNTTTDSTTTEFELSDFSRKSKKDKFKNHTILLPKKHITTEGEYQTEQYVEFCFSGISACLKNDFNLDYTTKINGLKKYAIEVINEEMKGLTEDYGELMTGDEEESWYEKINHFVSEYKNCS